MLDSEKGISATTPPPHSLSDTPENVPSEDPLSPALQALQIIRARYKGNPLDSQWTKIYFREGEDGDYETLCQELMEEGLWEYFANNEIRHDWNPHAGELILRTPTPLHDIFTSRIVQEIHNWLQSIRTCMDLDPYITALASRIISHASPQIVYEHQPNAMDGSCVHSPDASFNYNHLMYPSIVIETLCPQKRKDLPKLANDYLTGTRSHISTFIALDIGDNETKKATVSRWETINIFEYDFQTVHVVDAEPFRNEDGTPVLDGNITLSLHDFCPLSAVDGWPIPDMLALKIPYAKLARLLESSESQQI